MAVVLAKGLLGILGLFYNNNKGIKKERKASSLLNCEAFLN